MATQLNVLELRTKLDLNQQVFWKRGGVSQSGGCRYEQGRPMPSQTENMVKLTYWPRKKADALLTKLRKNGAA